jgi:hypothetical protein
MYPELSNISDQDLLEGLRQKYFPNMSAVDFSGQYQKNKEFSDFVLANLYVSRGAFEPCTQDARVRVAPHWW